jgi:hypothetical protein
MLKLNLSEVTWLWNTTKRPMGFLGILSDALVKRRNFLKALRVRDILRFGLRTCLIDLTLAIGGYPLDLLASSYQGG